MIRNSALFMFGVQGQTLNANEIAWLQHPLSAGVILFTRNYDNPKQLREFIQTLRQTAGDDILIAVDHEGGRVQRFRKGFTEIPAMGALGNHYDNDSDNALTLAKETAYVMAYELADCDIDFSFAPVLDVHTADSTIIGDRGFHHNVDAIRQLATAFYHGLHDAGMIAVGKHFPGHGNVVADSHLELPISQATLDELEQHDLPPFKALIDAGIEGIMPAHIRYEQIDKLPAGFSSIWLADYLRGKLHFNGCIISDDLDMAGAAFYGNIMTRIQLAAKHCDLILLCNHHEHMQIAFEQYPIKACSQRQQRLETLKRQTIILDKQRYQRGLARLRDAGLSADKNPDVLV